MKVENNIDRYFKENLKDFQVAPPEGVWDTIEQDLKKNSRKIIVPFYLKVAAGIILLASLASILWKVTNQTETVTPMVLSEKTAPAESIQDKENSEITVQKESESLLAKVEDIPSTSHSTNNLAPGEATSFTEESVPVLPAVDQESQKYVENETIPVEAEIETVIAEEINEPIPESPDNSQNTPGKEVNKNDVIMQQNLIALEENNKKSTPDSKSRWSIGGQAGPQYSYRDVSVSPDQSTQNYDQFEDGMLAFAGGVNVQMKAAKRFSIQSGVYYSKIGQEVSSMVYGNDNFNYDVVADGANANPSIGTLDISKNYRQPSAEQVVENNISEGSYVTEQYFEFVEIPMVFKYSVIDKKLNVSLNGGLWTQILVGNTAITTGNNDYYAKEETNDINTLNYSGSLGIGFNYPVTSNLLISLDPIFKYYLSPINSNPETEVHPYTFGIMTGINFNF